MKPKEKKPAIVFRVIDRTTGEPCGAYSRAYCNEYDFDSPEQARRANVNDEFMDLKRYAIAKYQVTYTLLDPDV